MLRLLLPSVVRAPLGALGAVRNLSTTTAAAQASSTSETATASAAANASSTPSTKSRVRRRPLKAPVTLTAEAVLRLKKLLAAKPQAKGLRIGVRRRGCNGLSYTMTYADDTSIDKFDDVVKQDDVTVYLDSKALLFIIGTEIDYVRDPIREEFVFRNPNSKGECGCGESFNV